MWRILSNRVFLRAAGVALICLSMVVSSGWFFYLVPYVKRYDPLWQAQFTHKTYWREIQENIHRHGWTHDDCFFVGRYGDKAWAQWIMSKVEAGQSIDGCGRDGHKDHAMRFITCNNPVKGQHENADWRDENAARKWLDWWSTNKEKSQLKWIQAGLRTYGVSVHCPPSEADNEPLLALLGNMSTNANEKIPDFVKYNAFRWLRDSGFQSIPYSMSNVTAQTPPLVREGILEYGKRERAPLKNDTIGILGFVAPEPDFSSSERPEFFRPKIQITGYSLMILPLLIGSAMLFYSRRHPKNKVVHP